MRHEQASFLLGSLLPQRTSEQVSTYLRAVGAKVPAIYVESGDEPYPPIGQTCSADIPPPPAF